MFLKAAVNGGRSTSEHPGVPITAAEIAADTAAVVAAGADVVHLHVRDERGGQTIRPDALAEVLREVRAAAPGAVLGTTTGLWTCSSPDERFALVKAWEVLPDFASVAFSEEGAAETAALVVARGMRLESAVWSMADVPALLASPTLDRNERILIEPMDPDPDTAVAHARAMAAAVRAAGVGCPLLYHGEDATVWPVLRAALADGHQIRIGFEDGTALPDGTTAPDNRALVLAALRAGHAPGTPSGVL
ncbi:3-keto-5-aminohexanoate cleavage protein [Streptomyces scopuliridis]|uniref:3-keto-5-aminohexanoate cleavage protein n=1 Tax=Streptomyces scopuliridis TaxID=452529 RepID=A0ACD4ZU00_9ACTN|nr:3-keto-5-aminohexanoate cleavage protein [Streptomyces scopuliridis]WSC01773.1 3-keto-5-aminohexanoate cleavage protein [Streptomyces scopuliridis]WSC04690.1 3-keto-5-aminohexanoate cleavage protein [Streptomyces scopuliridis]